jgi:hypothetical protein
MDSFQIFVVRPHHDEIRQPVYDAVRAVGGIIDESMIVQEETSPEEILDLLHDNVPDVFLLPFNKGEDHQGRKIHGLKTLALLLETYPWAENTPVLMPVSQTHREAFKGAWDFFIEYHAENCVLILQEEELQDRAVLEKRILNHIRTHKSA